MLNVRVRGVDTAVRNLVRANEDILDEAREGCEDAAEYLMDKIIAKFGVYQPTGGDPKGYGAWRKLAMSTRFSKMRRYGFSDRPLIATGATKDSFSIKKAGKGRLAASVSSDSDTLKHHVYGAPRANVPMRDPARVTAKEEKDKCHDIIMKKVQSAIRRA